MYCIHQGDLYFLFNSPLVTEENLIVVAIKFRRKKYPKNSPMADFNLSVSYVIYLIIQGF